jgi:hypothetical protein
LNESVVSSPDTPSLTMALNLERSTALSLPVALAERAWRSLMKAVPLPLDSSTSFSAQGAWRQAWANVERSAASSFLTENGARTAPSALSSGFVRRVYLPLELLVAMTSWRAMRVSMSDGHGFSKVQGCPCASTWA